MKTRTNISKDFDFDKKKLKNLFFFHVFVCFQRMGGSFWYPKAPPISMEKSHPFVIPLRS